VATTDRVLVALAAGCTQLEHLDLNGCSAVTNDGLKPLLAANPMLQLVFLHGCDIDDFALKMLADSCHSLQHVDIAYQKNVSDAGLCYLVRACRDMVRVWIRVLRR
jgi:hypothetical protein